MNENVFQLVLGVVTILCSIIAGFVVPYLQTKIDSEKLEQLVKWVTYAVQAAELLFNGEKQGIDKKDYVTDLILDYLNKKRIYITNKQLNVLIESAVANLKLK